MEANKQNEIREAVHHTLLELGFDLTDSHAIVETQRDMTFLRTWRQSAEKTRAVAWFTLVGLVVTGVVGFLVASLKGN